MAAHRTRSTDLNSALFAVRPFFGRRLRVATIVARVRDCGFCSRQAQGEPYLVMAPGAGASFRASTLGALMSWDTSVTANHCS